MQSQHNCQLQRGPRLCELYARSNRFEPSSGIKQQQSGSQQSKRWLLRGILGGGIILTGMGTDKRSFSRGFTVFAQTDKISEVSWCPMEDLHAVHHQNGGLNAL